MPCGRDRSDIPDHAVERLDIEARERVVDRPGVDDAPFGDQHQRVAQARREVQVVRGDDDGEAALPVEPAEQVRNFELVAHVERSRGLVEQQDVGLLRQRAGDDDALLLAARQRGELRRSRAACRWPPAPRVRSPRRAVPRARRRRGGGSGPSARSRAWCSRRRGGFPGARPRSSGRAPPRHRRQVPAVERHRAGFRPQHAGQQTQQRRLARTVGAENADHAAAFDADSDALDARQRGRPARPASAPRLRGPAPAWTYVTLSARSKAHSDGEGSARSG